MDIDELLGLCMEGDTGAYGSLTSSPRRKAAAVQQQQQHQQHQQHQQQRVPEPRPSDGLVEKRTGLRLAGRLIPTQVIEGEYLRNRKYLSLEELLTNTSKLRPSIESRDPSKAWATAGVIYRRNEGSGTKCNRWTLVDLSPQGREVDVWITDDVVSQVRGMARCVVYLLSPHPFPNKAGYDENSLTLSVKSPGQVVTVGRAKDFQLCAGQLKKTQAKCLNAVDAPKTSFCRFHQKSSRSGVGAVSSSSSAVARKSLSSSFMLTHAQNGVTSARARGLGIRAPFTSKGASASGPNVLRSGSAPQSSTNSSAKSMQSSQKINATVARKALGGSSHGERANGTQSLQEARRAASAASASQNVSHSILLQCDPAYRATHSERSRVVQESSVASKGPRWKDESAEVAPRKRDVLGDFLDQPPRKRPRDHKVCEEREPAFTNQPRDGFVPIPRKSRIFSRSSVIEHRPMSAARTPSGESDLMQLLMRQRQMKQKIDAARTKSSDPQEAAAPLSEAQMEAIQRQLDQRAGAMEAAMSDALSNRLNDLERREYAVQQMESIREKKIDAWYCCQDEKFVRGDSYHFCKQQGHLITKKAAIMRYFECNSCGHRLSELNTKAPQFNCEKCGADSTNWTQCGSSSSGLEDKQAPRMMGGISEWTSSADTRHAVMNV